MIQSQAINLNHHLQATPGKGGGAREAQAGKFEDLLNQGGMKLNRQQEAIRPARPGSLKGRAAEGTANAHTKPPLKQQPQEEEQDPALYVLPPLTPPTTPPPDSPQPEDAMAQALQILDNIVSILEGNQSNILTNKEIVPLLTKLEQTLAQLDQPVPEELSKMLEEVMARMPQTEDIAETPQKLAKLNQFIETLRGYLCPPENVNEDQPTTAEFMPLTEAVAAKNTSTSGFTADTESESQAKTEENAAAQPQQGAVFTIAPQRVHFAESLAALAEGKSLPFTAETLFETMVERIVSLPDADPHMEITLKPDNLGKLSIDLHMTENGLTAKILASDEGVRNMLAAHVNRLSETLAERGIRLENVEVIYTALSDKPFDQQRPGGQEARENAPRHDATVSVAEVAPAQPWESAYGLPLYVEDMELGLSSVEYRA